MKKKSNLFEKARARVQSLAYRNPLYALTLKGAAPNREALFFDDPWPGNALRGQEIMQGEFRFTGKGFRLPSLFDEKEVRNVSWQRSFHGFEWLRDLRAVKADAAADVARQTIAEWTERYQDWHDMSWSDPVLAERLCHWMMLAPFILKEAGEDFEQAFLQSLGKQFRHLARLTRNDYTGREAMAINKALILGGLCLPDGERALNEATHFLALMLAREIMADGTHISRHPKAHMMILRDLLDIRRVLTRAGLVSPPDLSHAITRMAPVLRFFRHGDHALALFHGSDENVAFLIDAVLAEADVKARAPKSLPHGGYEKLSHNKTMLIVDTGMPPLSGYDTAGHAGLAAFEMSVGRERIIVNCGPPPNDLPEWRLALAATAAHSTLCVADQNNVMVKAEGGLGPAPTFFESHRYEDLTHEFCDIMHGAYQASHNLTHKRILGLRHDGDQVTGIDELEGAAGVPITLRWHLHPSIQASLIQNSHAVLLRTFSGAGWRFVMEGGHKLFLESSLYTGDRANPRRCQQIRTSLVTLQGITRVDWIIQKERKNPIL
jgi:uncharacterized heparinase superfamily protein